MQPQTKVFAVITGSFRAVFLFYYFSPAFIYVICVTRTHFDIPVDATIEDCGMKAVLSGKIILQV